jgi:hypothetical protein
MRRRGSRISSISRASRASITPPPCMLIRARFEACCC